MGMMHLTVQESGASPIVPIPAEDPRPASAHRWLRWTAATAGTLVLNLALFALMPHLMDPSSESPPYEKIIPQINVIRMPRPEPSEEREAARLPEPPQTKQAPAAPQTAVSLAPGEFKMAFEINPRLTGGPALIQVPVKVTPFDAQGLTGPVAVGELDRPLIPLSRIPPVYPPGAKRRGIEGWVKVRFVVNPRGEVEEVTVVEAKPSGVFDDTVTRSVFGWRFQPGTVDGNPVSAWVETTVRFELE